MDLAKTLAKLRYQYHLNAIELINAGNQLGLIKDDKAEKANKKHVMAIMNDIVPLIFGEEAVNILFDDLED